MEECIICLDEKESFIFFPCNHKVCDNCFPLLVSTTNKCPLCNTTITIETESYITIQPVHERPAYRLDMCKIGMIIIGSLFIIMYIITSLPRKIN